MRLTVDLISRRPQFINPIKDRELDLRGQRIPVIENLSATQDQFDTIDLSDNDLKKVESATTLRRLKMLLASNNRISRLAEDLGAHFPNLEFFVLMNNDFSSLQELDPLASLTKLRCLTLVDNAVTKQPGYRLYVLHLLPKLRVLDFQKVKAKEVEAAREQFGSVADRAASKGKGSAAAGAKRARDADDGAPAADGSAPPPPPKEARVGGLPEHLVVAAREALADATSLDAVVRLERALKSGDPDVLRAELVRQGAMSEAPAADGGGE